jgi:hypothetical protein
VSDVETAFFQGSSETRGLGALAASVDAFECEEEGSLVHWSCS